MLVPGGAVAEGSAVMPGRIECRSGLALCIACRVSYLLHAGTLLWPSIEFVPWLGSCQRSLLLLEPFVVFKPTYSAMTLSLPIIGETFALQSHLCTLVAGIVPSLSWTVCLALSPIWLGHGPVRISTCSLSGLMQQWICSWAPS